MKKNSTIPLILMVILCLSSCIGRADGNSDNLQNKVLLTLIDKRLHVAPLVAKSKWNTQKPIDDPAREKIILDSVEVKAQKMSLDTKLASAFFKAQFEAGKIEQRRLHKEWKSQNLGLFNPVPDLATEVRPVLDSLTPQLLVELKKLNMQSEYCKSLERLRTNARKTIDSRFSDEIVNVAIEPIEKYCKEHK